MSSSGGRRRAVLVAGTWDEGEGYPRTRSLIDALRARGHEVVEARVNMPSLGMSKSRFLRSPWRWPGFLSRLVGVRMELVRAVRAAMAVGTFDCVLVPYPGHFAVRWVAGVVDVPVILDMFLSAYGTAVEDRRLFRDGSWAARMLRRLDRRAVQAADVTLLDTPMHADYVRAITGSDASRLDWVPICDAANPTRTAAELSSERRLRLLFFGTGVALHGLRHLLDAVAASPQVELTLVGGSDEDREHARRVIDPERLVLGPRFEPESELRRRIAACDLVAGIFGTSDKARAVVPFKVVHAMAHGKPVITGDTEAVRAMLSPETDCLVVPCGDSTALAERLGEVACDRRPLEAIGAAGRERFESTFSVDALGRRLDSVLARVVPERSEVTA